MPRLCPSPLILMTGTGTLILAATTLAAASHHPDDQSPAAATTVLEPVLTLEQSETPTARPRQSVAEILASRRQQGARAADENYAAVPGCEPLGGSLGDLPLIDLGHHVISRGLCLPGQWVDSWFSAPQADFYAARTLVRVIASQQWQEQTPRFSDLRIDARISLAHTEDRLSLILRSDDQQDDRLTQRDRTLRARDDGDPGVFRAALRWAAIRTRDATSLLDLGIRGRDPFLRMRWRYGVRLPWAVRMRLLQEFYWRDNQDRRGTDSEFQLERPLGKTTLVRITSSAESNTGLRRQDIRWIWSQSVSWFWPIRHRSAVQLSLQFAGRHARDTRLDSRRLGLRWKHSFWRPWLYLEIEPYVLSERASGFDPRAGTAVRLELQFGHYQ